MSNSTQNNIVDTRDLKEYLNDINKTKREKVAIVGFAKSWIDTPFEDESFEIWGLNELYKFFEKKPGISRADRWFEIHNPKSPSKNKPEHHKFLATCGIPVYMWKHFPEFPTSIAYPRQEVKDMFNENFVINEKGSKYSNFSNQITWMIGLAILEGFKEIHIYGVDMATKEEIKTPDGQITVTGEYIWQRPSVEAAIMFAAGRGIKVLVPQNSELCKFPQDYGFETDNQVRCTLKSRKQELINYRQKIAMDKQKLLQQVQQLEQKEIQLNGSISEVSHYLGNHIV